MRHTPELVVQVELQRQDTMGLWHSVTWLPIGAKLGTSLSGWRVAIVYPMMIRDLAAEREWM